VSRNLEIFGDAKLEEKKTYKCWGKDLSANGRGRDCARGQALVPRYMDFFGVAGRSAENFQRPECSKADIEMDN
jgi:hypothetical protein